MNIPVVMASVRSGCAASCNRYRASNGCVAFGAGASELMLDERLQQRRIGGLPQYCPPVTHRLASSYQPATGRLHTWDIVGGTETLDRWFLRCLIHPLTATGVLL